MFPSEKQFANLLTKQKKKWIFHPRHFNLYPYYGYYEPDFYLPKEDKYIEVVGTRQAYHSNKNKYQKVKELYPNIILLFLTPDGKSFIEKLRKSFRGKGIKLHIELNNNYYKKFVELANKEDKSLNQLGQVALEFYLKARKLIKNV